MASHVSRASIVRYPRDAQGDKTTIKSKLSGKPSQRQKRKIAQRPVSTAESGFWIGAGVREPPPSQLLLDRHAGAANRLTTKYQFRRGIEYKRFSPHMSTGTSEAQRAYPEPPLCGSISQFPFLQAIRTATRGLIVRLREAPVPAPDPIGRAPSVLDPPMNTTHRPMAWVSVRSMAGLTPRLSPMPMRLPTSTAAVFARVPR